MQNLLFKSPGISLSNSLEKNGSPFIFRLINRSYLNKQNCMKLLHRYIFCSNRCENWTARKHTISNCHNPKLRIDTGDLNRKKFIRVHLKSAISACSANIRTHREFSPWPRAQITQLQQSREVAPPLGNSSLIEILNLIIPHAGPREQLARLKFLVILLIRFLCLYIPVYTNDFVTFFSFKKKYFIVCFFFSFVMIVLYAVKIMRVCFLFCKVLYYLCYYNTSV